MSLIAFYDKFIMWRTLEKIIFQSMFYGGLMACCLWPAG